MSFSREATYFFTPPFPLPFGVIYLEATRAERVRLTILDTVDFLAENPALGRHIRKATPRHADIRWLVVPKYRNYLIFYRPFQDTIMVVRILHAAQDWKRFFPPSRAATG